MIVSYFPGNPNNPYHSLETLETSPSPLDTFFPIIWEDLLVSTLISKSKTYIALEQDIID